MINTLRKCKVCKADKDPRAFIASRAVCRLCWIYLPEEIKKENCTHLNYRQIRVEKRSFNQRFSFVQAESIVHKPL